MNLKEMRERPVQCLVRVTTNRSVDFVEWLEYHLALGFDGITVFDTGNRSWLDGVCEKYGQKVTVAPRNENWAKKSAIMSAYVSRRHQPVWAVIMDDNDFIWLDVRTYRSIKEVVLNTVPGAEAISVFTKYLSSEKPMIDRVGTQIDCFCHARPNPQGLVAPAAATPNQSLTIVFIPNNTCVPMANAVIPSSPNWVDTLRNRLTVDAYRNYVASKNFEPCVYPVRCYRYELRSKVEMEGRPGTKPVGYTVLDMSMQDARKLFMNIPANPQTETLFAKDKEVVVEAQAPHVPTEIEKIVMEIPLPNGRIENLILRGETVDGIMNAAVAKGYEDTDEHRKAVGQLVQEIRDKIIESSDVYRRVKDMLAVNTPENVMCEQLKIGWVAMKKVLKALPALDIDEYDARKASEAAEAAALEQKAADKIVANDDVAALTAAFDETVNTNKMNADEQAILEEQENERKVKQKNRRKASRKKKSEAAAAAAAKQVLDDSKDSETADATAELDFTLEKVPELEPDDSPRLPVKDEYTLSKDAEETKEPEESTNLLDEVDLSAFMNK